MPTSKAIAELLHEHEIILKVVGNLEGLANTLREHQQVEVAVLREAAAFMRNFADKCHHAKEEDLLFPALVAAGLPERNGPVAVLKSEHVQARSCIAKLATAIDAYEHQGSALRAQIIEAISCIGELYPQHIAKENEVLFPMSERLLTPVVLDDLAQKFEGVEEALGKNEHHRWAAVAERLGQQACRAKPEGTDNAPR